MNEIKSYKDLLIWKKGITIVKLVYQLVKTFPQEEMYALSSQLKRASVSIPSNIAEGCGRKTDKDFSNFLSISLGSAFEFETQLIICKNLGYILEIDFKTLESEIQHIQNMIIKLQNTIDKK